MKLLLTGKHGQVGFELQRSLSVLGEVISVDQAECDLADASAIRTLVRATRPEVIITPAAYTAVDKAESEEGLARAINAVAPEVFGEEAAKLGALVVHYSTDPACLRSRYTFWDIPVPKTHSIFDNFLCPDRPASVATPDSLVGEPSVTTPANGLTACRDALCIGPPRVAGFPIPPPTPAPRPRPTPIGDYQPSLRSPWLAAYVFDGLLDRPYVETDATRPQGIYGLTKRDGELALAAATPRHVILRTSWVVGAHGANFAKTMLRLAAERDGLSVVADQWGAPTSASLLADATAHLIRQWQRDGEAFPYGLYHLAAGGETNWCDYARFVISAAIRAGKPMKVMPEAVKAITTADYPLPAKRPANSRLDTGKFKQTFGLALPHWQAGLQHILDRIL